MRLLSLVFINHHLWFLVNIFNWRCPPLLDHSVSLTAQFFRAVCLHACSITGSLWDGWLESYPAESGSLHSWGRIFKFWRSPEIDSKELIPPAYVACGGNFSPAMGARNQVGIGLSYRPASLCSLDTQFQTRLMELIPRPTAGLKFTNLAGRFDNPIFLLSS